MRERRQTVEFADAVRRALRGLSQREASRRTGVSAPYIGDMLCGVVPTYPKLEQFVRGLGLRGAVARELFVLAGYAPPQDLVEDAGQQIPYSAISPRVAPMVRALELLDDEQLAMARRLILAAFPGLDEEGDGGEDDSRVERALAAA